MERTKADRHHDCIEKKQSSVSQAKGTEMFDWIAGKLLDSPAVNPYRADHLANHSTGPIRGFSGPAFSSIMIGSLFIQFLKNFV
jgi:hypothetical protein